ncbi:hypothetical protein Tco_1181620 [Tanacetum coccineum]
MSKRNLATVTYSLTQSDLVEFVEKYGIALCYDPQLPSSEQTALDAQDGYISLCLYLFSIANLHLPLNTFCLYVFKFFDCHLPLLNPFGVAQVTTFVVVCKAYGGEPTLPLFRSLYTTGPAGDWLTFQKRSRHDIPQIFDSSMTNIPNWKSEFIFIKKTLISNARPTLITDFHHSLEPIMYLDDLASYWEYSPSAPIILFYRKEMSFRNFMKKPSQTPTFSVRPSYQPIDVDSPFVDHSKAIDDNNQGASSFVLKNQDVVGFELAVVGDSPSDQGIGVVESSKKKCSITAALEEGATLIKLDDVGSSSKHKSRRNDVKEAYSAHNVLSGLHHPSLKNKPDSLSLDDLANVYDVHALNLTMIGNMLTNKSRVVSLDYSKLKSDFLSFRSKNGLLEHEMSTLEDSLSRARKNQDVESSQKLFDEFDRVRPSVEEVESLGKKCKDLEAERESLLSKESSFREEVDALSSRLKIADLKKVELVRDFLPLAVKKLFSSKHFNSALDVEDYNPEAEKVLDEAVEAFYKLDFPYISLLVEKSGESLCSLVVVDPPTIQEAPPL